MQGTLHTTVNGVLREVPNVGIFDAYGDEVPADGATGYVTGATFRHTDGGDGTAFYVNEGTKLSADFNAATIA